MGKSHPIIRSHNEWSFGNNAIVAVSRCKHQCGDFGWSLVVVGRLLRRQYIGGTAVVGQGSQLGAEGQAGSVGPGHRPQVRAQRHRTGDRGLQPETSERAVQSIIP